MHFLLATLGTDGDVFPYFGIGCELLRRGHRVTLATHEHYRARADACEFAFASLATDAETQEFLGNPDLWRPMKSGLHGVRWGLALIPRQFELLAEMAAPADTVLVANPGVLPARLVQEKLGRPLASILLQPGMIPSVSAPPVMPNHFQLPTWAPAWAGWAFWRTLDAIGDTLIGPKLNRFRKTIGLPPMRRIFRWWLSPELVLGMFPEWYAQPQADWPPQIRTVGFAMYDGPAAVGSPELPPDLEAFLAVGPPPVAFTFGTGMMHGANFSKRSSRLAGWPISAVCC